MFTSGCTTARLVCGLVGATLFSMTGCSYSPDAGLGPAPVQDAWVVCVNTAEVRGTELSEIVNATADTLTHLPGYAETAAWYRRDEPITLNGRRYARIGYLRRLNPDGFAAHGREMVRVGEQQGVPLYAEGPDPQPPGVLWIPVRPGCVFQSYQRGHHGSPRG
jgi:hypothetical protein